MVRELCGQCVDGTYGLEAGLQALHCVLVAIQATAADILPAHCSGSLGSDGLGVSSYLSLVL